jgi:putative membrane protein
MTSASLRVLGYLLPWEFSPTVLLVCLTALWLYLRGVSTLRRVGAAPGAWCQLAFLLGLALDYAVLQTRFDFLSQHMFWIHRLQHLILHHVAAVLLVLAAPGRALLAGVPAAARTPLAAVLRRYSIVGRLAYAAFRFVQHPLVAPLLFVGLIYLWLVPRVHFAAMLDADLYQLMNWSMAIDGILFWWLMLAPRAAQGHAALGYGLRLLIVPLIALPQIALGAYIALHHTVLFDVYNLCGRAWQVSPLVDQELGGVLTWIPTAMMSGVATLLILRLAMREAARDGGLCTGTIGADSGPACHEA